MKQIFVVAYASVVKDDPYVVELDFRKGLSLAWSNHYVFAFAFTTVIGGLLFGFDTSKSAQPYFNINLPICFM